MLNALYSLGVTIVQGYYHHEISCVTTGNSIWSYLDKLGSKWTSDSKCHSLKSFEGSFESWSQPFPWQRSLNWLDYVLEEKFHSLGSVIISVTAALLQRNARAEMCSDEICSQLGAACQERLWIASLNVFFNRFLIYQHKKNTLWFCYGSQSCPQIFSHNFLWMFSIELPTTEHYIQWGKIQTSYEIFILESWWTFAYYTINTALTLKPY